MANITKDALRKIIREAGKQAEEKLFGPHGSVTRAAALKKQTVKKNPIVVVGNPPHEIHATVEGVIYNRCVEIRAEKTQGKYKGLWKHPFKRSSKVQILGLDNGDLLVHSSTGERLWRED